jgi:hypothetical protein
MAEQSPLQLGPLTFMPHLTYRLAYNDNLGYGVGQQTGSLINELSPGMLVKLGDRWNVNYTPTLRFYSNDRFRDRTDHSVYLSGGTSYEDWTFGLSQGYVSSSDPLVETGRQTDQETFSTGLSGNWLINSALSLELGLSQTIRGVNSPGNSTQFQDSKTWSTTDWLNYQYAPTLGLAIGGGVGYMELSSGSDVLFEQLQGRINWQASSKVGVTLSGGADFREYQDSSIPASASPIFGLTARYQPFDYTTLSLTGSRSVNASYYRSQLTEDTMISANLSQRLVGKLTLYLGGGFGNSQYKSASSAVQSGRGDDRTFFNASLSLPFLRRASASVSYSYNENISNTSGYTRTSNQYGLQLSYRF